MAKKKRHITSLEELNQALRIVGGIFPHTINELDQTFKLSDREEIDTVASKYSFEDIWNSPEPLSSQQKSSAKITKLQSEINTSCGMVARGSHELSEFVRMQMIENEKKNEK